MLVNTYQVFTQEFAHGTIVKTLLFHIHATPYSHTGCQAADALHTLIYELIGSWGRQRGGGSFISVFCSLGEMSASLCFRCHVCRLNLLLFCIFRINTFQV